MIAMIIDHILKLLRAVFHLIQNNMVVNWSRGTLQSNVRVQEEVPVVGAGNVPRNKGTRQWVTVLVRSVSIIRPRKSPEMVTLVRNHHGELSIPLVLRQLHKD